MRSARMAAAAVILAATAAGSYSAQAQTGAQGTARTVADRKGGSVARVVTAANGFGFRLFTSLLPKNGDSNVFISPASVAMALDMAYDGARGSTQKGMAAALGLGAMSTSTVRQRAGALIAGLQSNDPQVSVSLANSLWARTGTNLKKQFVQHVHTNYAAKVQTLDFNSSTAPATINQWVKDATHGTIPGIISKIPPETMLYLINAVYFKGDWSTPFNPRNTHPAPFTNGNGTAHQVPMMNLTGTFPYYAGPNFSMISLQYGGKRFSMMVVLPKSGVGLSAMQKSFTDATWNDWIAHLSPQHGALALPRFSMTNTYMLNRPLAQLGMGTAFSDSADFLGMCSRPCKLSEVRHKTFLDVYEKGTTAAAATSVGVVPTAIQPNAFTMTVDHPFLLAIRDSQTGTLLFLGGVNAPKA